MNRVGRRTTYAMLVILAASDRLAGAGVVVDWEMADN
jgi:hypothetical protein